MNQKSYNENMFDAMMRTVANDLVDREMDSLPPDEEIDHVFSDGFEKKMNCLLRGQKRRRRKTSIKVKRVLVTVLIVVTLAFGGLMCVASVRESVIVTLKEIGEKHFGFRFADGSGIQEPTETEPPSDGIIRPQFIPEGFIEESCDEWGAGLRIMYVNENDDMIFFDQYPREAGIGLFVDSEDTENSEVEINGITVHLFDGYAVDGVSAVAWETEDIVYKFTGDCMVDELFKMARSILEKRISAS